MLSKNNKMIFKLWIWMMVLLVASSQLMVLPSNTAHANSEELDDLPIVSQEKTIESIPPINVETFVDEQPVIPSVIQAVYSDSTTAEVMVSWDSIESSNYAQVGTFTVKGSVEGTSIKAEAAVTVLEKSKETTGSVDIETFLDELKNNVPSSQEVVSYTNNYQSMEPEAMTFVKGNGTTSVNNGLTVTINNLGGSGAIATWDKAPWLSGGIIDTTMRYNSTNQSNIGFVLGSNDSNQGVAIRYDAGTTWVIQSPDGTSEWETFDGPELKMETDYHIQIGFHGTKLLIIVDDVTYYNKNTDLLSSLSGLGQIGLYKRYATGEIAIKSLRIEGVGTKEKPANIVNYVQDYENSNYTPHWSGLKATVVTDITGNKVLSLKKGSSERGVDLDSPQIQQGTLSLDFKLVNPDKLVSGQGFAFGFRMNDSASIFNELGVDPSSWIPESNTGWGDKQEIPYPIQGRWNNLMFNFNGKKITVFLNKKRIGDISFEQYSEAAGRFGLRIRSTVELQIDNVQYTNQIIEPKQIAQYSNDFEDGIKGTWTGADSTIITEGSNRVLRLSNIKDNVMNLDAPSLQSATYMLDVKPATTDIGFVIGDGAIVKYEGTKWVLLNKDGNSTDFVISDAMEFNPLPNTWNKVGLQYSDHSVILSINGATLQANLLEGQQFGEGSFGIVAQNYLYIDNVVFTEEFLDMNTSSPHAGKLRYEEYYEGDPIVNWEGFKYMPQVANGYLQGMLDAGTAAVNKDVNPVPNGIYQVKMQTDGAAGITLGNIVIYEESPGSWKYKLEGSNDALAIGATTALASGKDYTLRVEMIENELGLYVNGIRVGSVNVTGYTPGSFGIYNSATHAIQVKIDAITAEEVRVYAPDYNVQNWGPLDNSKPEVLAGGNSQIQLNMPGVSLAVDKDSPKFNDQLLNFDFNTNVSAGADGGRYGFIVRGSAADKYVGVVHDINGKWKVTTSNGNEISFPNTYQMQANTNYHIELRLVGTTVSLNITGPDGVVTDMGSISEESMAVVPGWFGVRSWYGTKQMTLSNLKMLELESLPKLKLAQETDTIEKDGLSVTIYKDFPGIVEYQMDHHTLQADVEQTNSVKINNKDYVPRTVSKKENASTYQYTMTFDEIGVVIDGHLEAKANNVVRFEMDKISDGPDFLVRSIQMNNALIHVNSSMKDASYAWSKSNGEWHGVSEELVDDMSLMKQSGSTGVTMAMVSGDGLAASAEDNVMSGGNKLIITTEKKTLVNKITVKPGSWTYRHLQSSETEELPWYEVVVTGERNNDDKTDWQDAAVAYRTEIYNEPFGAQDMKNNMMYIAFNFASQANDPFLNSLDTGKVLYNFTDGFGQMILHKGYQAEGHDDDIPSYSNIGVRQGGLDDFNYLIDEGDKYNLHVGVHLNATEYHLDANELDYSNLTGATANGPKLDRLSKGWDWIDTAYYVDQTKDVLSGELKSRLTNLYNLTKDANNPKDPALDFYYVDVYTGNDYNAYKLLQYANGLGVKVGTEFSGPIEPGVDFVHWGPDLGYPNKGNKSILSRMVKNNLDIFVGNALFKGQKIPGVTTWGDSKPDIQQGVTVFFNEVLPTKYMQHFGVLKYEEDQVTFDHDVVSKRNKSTGMIELTKNGKLISSWKDTGTTTDESVRHTGEANSLIPWVWDIKANQTLGVNDGAKLYHWNTTGNTTTWQLTDEFKDVKQFNMYELTQQGKVLVDTLVARNESLTITKAKKNTPYVLYPASADALTLVPNAGNWGEGSLIKDFAFNSEKFNVPGSWTVDDPANITIKTVQGDTEYDITKEMNKSNWNRYAEVGSDSGVISQEINGLQPGQDYTVGVWTQTEKGRKSSLQVTVNGQTYSNDVTGQDGIHKSSFKYVDTKWQRMNVEFKVPVGIHSATVKLVADPGAGTVQFDDVRIWKHTTVEKDPANKGYVVYEDFENVYEGWGPFEYGGGDRKIHIATDQSNKQDNNPVVSASENKVGPVMTWVLDGENSLKVNETDVGKLIKTNESSVKMEPNTEYDLGFIYTLEKYAGYEVSVQSRSTGEIVLKEALSTLPNPGNKAGEDGGYIRFQKKFITGAQHDYQVIFKMVSKGAGNPTSDYAFILDDFYIKEKLAVSIVSIENVQVETEAGSRPILPSQVTVTLSNDTTENATVVWEAIDPSLYAQAGSFQVKGAVNGTDIKAIATVKVKAKDSSNPGTNPGTGTNPGSNPDTGSNASTGTKPEIQPNPGTGTNNGSDQDNQTGTKPDTGNTKPKAFLDTVGHWANKEIEALVSKGIIKGMNDQKFAPDLTINRSEIAAMLTRALGLKVDGSSSFKDVTEDKWYKDDVRAVANAGLFKGYAGNLFEPMKPLSREEMAVIIVRTLEMKGRLPEASNTTQMVLSKYKDADKAGIWSREALAICIELGFIQGTPDHKLNPKRNLTRAEAAVLLSRLLTYCQTD
ncbi:endo-alpha-N-acetylgalactosaminidase family protein [Paenibacillus taichungensis]|uniref:endo-alpha-N-acetylgalactosaminidase family protein n=1 Tax=Paenibacillus taichungensis TaxID=484184 RepID=UPI0038D0C7C1